MIFGFLNPQSAMGFDLTQLLVCYFQDISKYPHESGQNNIITYILMVIFLGDGL